MAELPKVGLAYNPEAAKKGMEEHWALLKDLKTMADAGFDAASAHEAVLKYRKLPSFQVNWGLIGVTEEAAQVLADDVRAKINDANSRLGSNAMPLPRAFGAH